MTTWPGQLSLATVTLWPDSSLAWAQIALASAISCSLTFSTTPREAARNAGQPMHLAHPRLGTGTRGLALAGAFLIPDGRIAAVGPGLLNIFLALGFTNWAYSCRITRSQVLSARSLDYVIAARALGYGRVRIMFTQILPNVMGPILVVATLGVAGAILIEASLSFLGLGTQPPTPSWGGMLSTAREQLFTAPWISIFPGIAIFVTVLGLNLLGDGLRDILDPHTVRQRKG